MGKKNKNRFMGALKKMNGLPGITIGRPIGSSPKHMNNYQVHALFKRLAREGYTVDEYDLWNPYGMSIAAQARNMIVDTFLRRDGSRGPKHEYLLFIDDDQCFPYDYDPYDAFEMLINAKKDIVGAVTVRRFLPYKPNISIMDENTAAMNVVSDFPENEPFRVNQLGFGMVLIKRDVIEKMYHATEPPAPLFYNPLQYNPMHNVVQIRGEDYMFCIEAQKHGYDIWVEPRIPLLHIGDYPFGIDNWNAYKDDVKKNTKEVFVDLCQDTNLYAPLADALRGATPASAKGPVKLSDAISAEKTPDETIRESSSQQKNGMQMPSTPNSILSEKSESSRADGGSNDDTE